jgi:hypothetical protein
LASILLLQTPTSYHRLLAWGDDGAVVALPKPC